MSQTAPAAQDMHMTREEAVATIRRIRAEIAEQTKDLTDDEKEALVEELSRDIKSGMAERLRTKLEERP